jgi:hypothetical protein
MNTARYQHTATLLPSGKVLVAGGANDSSGGITSAEVYDPANESWTATTGNMNTARYYHTATLLPGGKVLVAGGFNDSDGYLSSAEVYDPATGSWSATGNLNTARFEHTATLLPSGKVLVTAGYGYPGDLTSAEVYDVGLGFDLAWQPQIATSPSTLLSRHSLVLTGSLFQGISQASGGNAQDSSSNYPIVQVRSIDSSAVVFLPVDPTAGWSDTSFTSAAGTRLPIGPALVTVFTNAIPSEAKYLTIPSNLPKVEFQSATYQVQENHGSVALTLYRATGLSRAVTVHVATGDNTALAGSDYTAKSVDVTIPAGSTTSTFTIGIINDPVPEANETFTVTIIGTESADPGPQGTATVTIVDKDLLPTIQFASASYQVKEAAGHVLLTLKRTGNQGLQSTVHFATQDGSAIAGSDYQAKSGDVVFTPGGANTRTISIPIMNNNVPESSEGFQVKLTSSTSANIGTDSAATVTILDFD